MRGPSFGSSQISVTSTLVALPDMRPTTTRRRSIEFGITPFLLVVGEELAEIAEAAGAEQRVDHGVGEDVRIRVSGEAAVVLDLDPADHQALPLDQPVAVVSDSDPQPHQVLASPESRTSGVSSPGRPSGASLRSRPSKMQIWSTPRDLRNAIASS